jgi:hypothetical protein
MPSDALLESVANFRTTDYDEDVDIQFQQMGSLLKQAVNWESMRGNDATFNVITRVDAVPITGIFAETPPPSNPDHIVRVVTPRPWDQVEWIDEEEWLRDIVGGMLRAKYAALQGAALGRLTDRLLLQRLRGNAFERTYNVGANEYTTTTVPYPAAQRVAHLSQGFSVDKLINAQELIKLENVPGNQLWCAITTKQWAQMMMDGRFTGFEYNDARPLKSADEIGRYAGINFIRVNIDIQDVLTDGTTDTALLWAKQAVGVKEQKPISTSVAILPERRDTVQLRASLSFDATRIQDKGVVEIQTLRAA